MSPLLQAQTCTADLQLRILVAPCGNDLRGPMLYHAIVFLLLALVAAVFGFTEPDTAVAALARVVCGISLVIASVAILDYRTTKAA